MQDYINHPRIKYTMENLPGYVKYILVAILFFMTMGLWTLNKIETSLIESYNAGYLEGQLFAYDNVVICGASPETEGLNIARILNKPTQVSDIICYE